jgi:hypothetical protein
MGGLRYENTRLAQKDEGHLEKDRTKEMVSGSLLVVVLHLAVVVVEGQVETDSNRSMMGKEVSSNIP